ncbi:competence type IV pilus minor pilin ComGD [Peribacillus sp. SCS-26]|uniref:competence type IV pilus minor pilin ComGD n=1 Tax=Paraperibacillus marinus TaxID=3115295 RepID=UPI00390617F5
MRQSSKKKILKIAVFNQKGFTFSEALVVLTIFLLISGIVLNLKTHPQETFQAKLFIRQFAADILLAQQYAMSSQSVLFVTIDMNSRRYSAGSLTEKIYTREIPDEIELHPGTLGMKFHFTASGNISKAGILHIKCGNRSWKMTFQLGKGRFYLNEQ